MDAKPDVLFVLGGPGSGKGTQCAKLVEKYGFVHLSAGDLLRAERNSGSKNAILINDYINKGAIVPVEITVNLIKLAMEQSGWAAKRYIIDGFPRNADNLDGWNGIMENITDVKGVLFLETTEATMESRLLERGKTSGRADDKAEVIKKRFETYQGETMPIINLYGDRGMVYKVDSGAAIDEVFAMVTQETDKVSWRQL